MATVNPFDLLGDNDNDDPSQLIAAAQLQKAAAQQQIASTKKGVAGGGATQSVTKQAQLPSKPLPPAQSVREAKSDAGRGYGRGRGGGGYDRDSARYENKFGSNYGLSGGYRPSDEGVPGKNTEKRVNGGPRPRRGGFSNGDAVEGERPRREYERHSGTGHRNEFKREGSGRGNWGTATDEIAPESEVPIIKNEKNVRAEKPLPEEAAGEANEENLVTETEEKELEPEEKEMTLEEYEKVLEEKRKALLALKNEERKVVVDKDLKSMQQLSSKKTNNEIFAKLGLEKSKSKEIIEKEEKAKKSLSISEFLKPAEGERYYNPGGRGRGRGRDPRGGYTGGSYTAYSKAPSIEDKALFPTLGAK